MDQSKWKENMQCPVCGKGNLAKEFDICKICFWENDPCQYEDPEFIGANRISLNNYKKWWNVLECIMPNLIKKYSIKVSNTSHWKYDELIVPRDKVKSFVDTLTKHNIEIRLSFYNWAEKFGFKYDSFIGYPNVHGETIKEINNQFLDIIFTENPIETCKNYSMKQVVKILKKSKNAEELWQSFLPYVCIGSNPNVIPNM